MNSHTEYNTFYGFGLPNTFPSSAAVFLVFPYGSLLLHSFELCIKPTSFLACVMQMGFTKWCLADVFDCLAEKADRLFLTVKSHGFSISAFFVLCPTSPFPLIRGLCLPWEGSWIIFQIWAWFMSIVLSCWISSCATLNLWGDLDTTFSSSGFPGKTASGLRLKKLILAQPISWTVLILCFPYWRAIPAFCLFYWYVAFTTMGCYPGLNLGGLFGS